MSSASPSERTHFIPTGGRALRVLIVDDNRPAALSLKDAVEDFGDTAEVCFAGAEAVARVVATHPDVLLLDLSMPGMEGTEIARRLRARPDDHGLKIIAVTAHGDAETRHQTAAAGFDLHLTKPVRFDVLEDMLDLLRHTPHTKD